MSETTDESDLLEMLRIVNERVQLLDERISLLGDTIENVSNDIQERIKLEHEYIKGRFEIMAERTSGHKTEDIPRCSDSEREGEINEYEMWGPNGRPFQPQRPEE